MIRDKSSKSLAEQLQSIRCVSEYEPRLIADDLVQTIVQAASWAPSAADDQPWEIIAVRDPVSKAAMVSTLLDTLLRPRRADPGAHHWLISAPLVLVLCLDHMRASARYGEAGDRLFGIQDTGAALQNMRLIASEHGIKSCLIREFDHSAMAQRLELPRHVEPLILVTMGFSSKAPVAKPALPLQDYLHLERW